MSPAENDYPEAIKTLEAAHPKLGGIMRRIYRWRIVYAFLGFLLSAAKSIVELVLETGHN